MSRSVIRCARQLSRHATEELGLAVAEAVDAGSPSPHSVRMVLERRRHQRGEPPPLPVALPDNDAIRNATVRPHPLSCYDPAPEDSDVDACTPLAIRLSASPLDAG